MTAISLIECIDRIKKLLGKDLDVKYGPVRTGDLSYFVGDIIKAQKEIGWEPKILPQKGIRLLIDWIEENRDLFRQDWHDFIKQGKLFEEGCF